MRASILFAIPLLTIIAADIMSGEPSDDANLGRGEVSRSQEDCTHVDKPGIIELFQQWACADEQVTARVERK